MKNLIDQAINLIRMFAPKDGRPYYGCFSGGKDSCVVKDLVRLAGEPVQWHMNMTTLDPPELLAFIKQHHRDVKFLRSRKSFFQFMVGKGFPTRRQRWCCRELKERITPKGERLLMGLRAEESPRRAKNWSTVSIHRHGDNTVVSPIFHWSNEQVWAYIVINDLPFCSLYAEGFARLGCIGCPMGTKGQRLKQFARWPKFHERYRQAFQRLWERKHGTFTRTGRPWFGDRHWDDWEGLWNWWVSNEPIPSEKCQGMLELFS